MSGGHEIMLAFQWLYGVLSGDSTLTGYATGGIWRGVADPGVTPPYVIMSHQGGSDTITMNAFRIMSLLLFQVKAVGPASITQQVTNAAFRIDQLIGSPPTAGSVVGGTVLACYRESALVVDELITGEKWVNIGGLYRLEIEQGP